MNQLPEAFLTRMRRQLEAEFEAYMTPWPSPLAVEDGSTA